MDYRKVDSVAGTERLVQVLRAEAGAGRRISVDLEDGTVDGKRVPLVVGFGWGHYERAGEDWRSWKGGARAVVLDHPEGRLSSAVRQHLGAKVKEILEDKHIRKVFQHGSYDVPQLEAMLNLRVRGYDFDSQYGAYLRDSRLRRTGLQALAYHWFPEFADYKQIPARWNGNYADVPLDRLVVYNCADCDLTKRIETKTNAVNPALMEVYIHTAFVLDDMESRGLWLDEPNYELLLKSIDAPIEELRRKLCHLAGKEDFNPDAPAQVAWLLYDKLKLRQINGRSTDAEVLKITAAGAGGQAAKWTLQYRSLRKVKTTYLVGYKRSADKNGGQVRTKWWLTGAVTGRLRSGGGDETEVEGVVNMQNLHGNTLLKNLLVSSPDWRRALHG
jgi:DNA polymerase I-like protein with 3'-5' exonuclease and polymerase domains